jgi:hypothetical protein
MFNPMQSNPNFTIKQLLVIATNPCKPIYNRSYTLNTTNRTLEKLYHIARPENSNSYQMSELRIANNIPEIIDMDPAISGEANVPNGWSTERLRFIMEVEYDFCGNMMSAYIQGLTEFHDPSYSNMLDPNMKFYINSITSVIKTIDPFTKQLKVQFYNSYNLLTNLDDNNYYGITADYKKTVRPEDMFNSYYLNEKIQNGESIYNLSDELTPNKVLTSQKLNNNPMNYLSKSMEAYRVAKVLTDVSWDNQSIMDNAKSTISEPLLANNPFLFAITNLTGMVSPNYFTLDMLMRMDNQIINKMKKFNREQIPTVQQYYTMLNTDDPSETLNPTIENLKACLLANTIPAICIECLITKCTISISNTSGEPVVFITNPGSIIDGIDMISFLEKLELKIKQCVLTKLTEYGQLLVEAFIDCDIIGDFTVGISINNQPIEVFRYPAYADSLYAPMITNNVNKNILLDSFQNILDSTYSSISPNTGRAIEIDGLS